MGRRNYSGPKKSQAQIELELAEEAEQRRLEYIARCENDPLTIDTPKELEEFADFAKRWEAINAEGEARNWLHWTGYESGPELWSPSEREDERQRDLRIAKRREEERQTAIKKARAEKLAETAAEKARKKAYEEAMR